MSNFDLKGLIAWLYYRDLPRDIKFYEEVRGFSLEVDQGWSKIYKVREGAYIGLVDERHGYHGASDANPVIICLNVLDADSWFNMLKERGVELEGKPKESERLRIRFFMFRDPEGYVIEIQESLPGALSS